MIFIYIIDTYKDLKAEIDVCRMNIARLEDEIRIHTKDLRGPGEVGCQQYSDMPKGSKRDVNYVESVIARSRAEAKLEKENVLLKGKLEELTKIDTKLKNLTGDYYKVYKLKRIDGLNDIQVAQRLNMCDKTVRNIMKKIG